ncbi:hypothetical protein MVEG_05561 [Podila verticillata NRRL 6337]|nr:hypothetical protein MVEG_05561 [Podila verticillata NRRL 6337]
MVAKDDNSDREMHQLLQELLHDPLLSDIATVNEEDTIDSMASTAKPRRQIAQKVDSETVDIMLAQAELMIQAELGGACRARLEREEHDPIEIVIRLDGTVKDLKRLVQQHIERDSRRAVIQTRQKIMSSEQQAAMEVEEGEITESNSKDMDVDMGTKKKVQKLPNQDSKAEKKAKADKTLPKFTNINWKYIWSSSCLCLDGRKLLDNNLDKMRDLGLRNGSVLTFVPHRVAKIKKKKGVK